VTVDALPGDDAASRSIGSAPVQGALARQLGITAVALALFVFFSLTADHFFEIGNILDVGRLVAFTTIVGVAMTYLFIAGEFDISVGSHYAFATIVMGILVAEEGFGPWSAAIVVIVMGAVVGSVNGLITTFVGVPSFIVTLGMFSLLRGAALVLSGAFPITFPPEMQSSFFSIAAGTVLGIPAQVIWMVVVLVVGGLVLKLTPFGYHVYATGGNAAASLASGIRTMRVKNYCFILTGASVGLIAALQAGWLKTVSPTTGSGFELQVIGAVIIGGVALQGGEGSVYGTFLGAAILGMLNNGIVLLGVDGNYTQIFIGLIIIVAATLDVTLRREGKLAEMLGAGSERVAARTRARRAPAG
jgi:ribose/xylose/arabinose/galactoside ABC-type transport system permease subunit